jgi:hypothetical protein
MIPELTAEQMWQKLADSLENKMLFIENRLPVSPNPEVEQLNATAKLAAIHVIGALAVVCQEMVSATQE